MGDGGNMRTDLKDTRKVIHVKNSLTMLFNGDIEQVKVEGVSPSDIIDIISSVDGGIDVNKDDMDLNGWQCDYWISFNHRGKRWSLYGGAWYGNATIEKHEDEED